MGYEPQRSNREEDDQAWLTNGCQSTLVSDKFKKSGCRALFFFLLQGSLQGLEGSRSKILEATSTVKTAWTWLPSGNQTWQWKIPHEWGFNKKNTCTWFIFHGHVWFLAGTWTWNQMTWSTTWSIPGPSLGAFDPRNAIVHQSGLPSYEMVFSPQDRSKLPYGGQEDYSFRVLEATGSLKFMISYVKF